MFFYEPGRSFSIKLPLRRTLVHFINEQQNTNSIIIPGIITQRVHSMSQENVRKAPMKASSALRAPSSKGEGKRMNI